MVNQKTLDWARTDPLALLAAARWVAAHPGMKENKDAQRLVDLIASQGNRAATELRLSWLDRLLKARPEALVEAAQIVIDHADAVVRVMTTYGYTDPAMIGGYLDRDLPGGG
jgi:putative NADPH-quinone reductase